MAALIQVGPLAAVPMDIRGPERIHELFPSAHADDYCVGSARKAVGCCAIVGNGKSLARFLCGAMTSRELSPA